MNNPAHQILRLHPWQDATALAAKLLADALTQADLFDDDAAVYITGHERRARGVRHAVRADFPEGTPERVARTLLARLAPHKQAIDPVDRDFRFFALVEKSGLRKPSRALVDALLGAFKTLASCVAPGARRQITGKLEACGERGALFSQVILGYLDHLQAENLHDPEDVLWHAADLLAGKARFAPRLCIVDDLETVSPARHTFIKAILGRSEASLTILRGDSHLTPFVAPAHEALQNIVVSGLGGNARAPEGLVSLNRAELVQAWLEDSKASKPVGLSLLRPLSRAAEVTAAARTIKLWAKQGVPLDEICVAMPRQHTYRALIETGFTAAGIPFDMPLDTPLAQTLPVGALLELVSVARSGMDRLRLLDALTSPWLPFDSRSNPARLARLRALTRRAGILDGADPEIDWQRPLQPCLESDGDRAAAKWLLGVVAALQPLAEDRIKAARFFEALHKLVDSSGIKGVCARATTRDGFSPEPAKALHEFSALCTRLARGFAGLGDEWRDTAELYRALVEQAQGEGVRPPEDGEARVRVLGLLDLGVENHDRVMVLGLCDRDLPLPEREDFFFSSRSESTLARVLGEDLARKLVQPLDVGTQADWLYARALAAGTGELVLSFPQFELDEEVQPAPQHARLLRVLGIAADWQEVRDTRPVSPHALACDAARLWSPNKARAGIKDLSPSLRAGLHGRRLELARSDVTSGPGMFDGAVGELDALKARFAPQPADGSYPYSPSQVDLYAQCPHSFWARHVLGVKEPREPTRDTPPWAVGVLVHSTLHRFVLLLREALGQPREIADIWKRPAVRVLDLGKGDAAAARQAALPLMRRALEQAREAQPTPGPFWAGIVRSLVSGLEGPEAPGLLARFIDHELENNAAGFGIRWVEFSFGRADYHDAQTTDFLESPLVLPLPDGELRMTGSIDRVDEGPDGLVVVDYKTSGTRKPAEIRDGKAFQLPMYLAALSRGGGLAPSGMMYLKVPAFDPVLVIDVTKPRSNSRETLDVGALVNEALPRRLSAMLAAMRAGAFMHLPFARPQNVCNTCDFAHACAMRLDVVEQRQARLAEGEPPLPGAYLPDAPPEKQP